MSASTNGAAGHDAGWRLGTSLGVHLGAGLHMLCVGTIGASEQDDRAVVPLDNVSLIGAVPEPASAALLAAGGLALLCLRGRCRR